ncbi:MAG TPA: hypothetical protein DCM02_07040 [Flavobacterium sp.]|nr:hypothetical protein [Flavobacterium sp.]HAT77448.1 hypothetical protein [Flavobacterium sp.]
MKNIKKTGIKTIYIFSFFILIYSCQSDRSGKIRLINNKSNEIFNVAIDDLTDSKINIDSLKFMYSNIRKDSAELGLEFANKLKKFSHELKLKSAAITDSLNEIEYEKIKRENIIAEKKWFSSKAGRIQKKHPNWTEEDCKKIANREIWIGMKYEMLVYQRGKPNTVNPSNYGNGIEYQCCWDDYSPSCFYMKEDDIIYAYN